MAISVPDSGGQRTLDGEDFARIESLFALVAALDGDARLRAIQAACADRPDLQREIEALLAAHDRLVGANGFANDYESGTGIGSVVGAYRLIEKIGEGGMGEVFLAERADGLYTQHVAVKITRSTIGHSDDRRRFAVERQILASLTHEHIVRLLDGGTTATGQAFLIMEYVEGVSLTRHCRERALSLETRLALFGKVCSAVQYAHQHGIVHRDLKPANILVGADDVPKVMDFGVAKLLEGDAGGTVTLAGMAGPLTPNYASPEQMRGLLVTTASDVYSLGVILYELLADARPYETRGETLERMLQVVVHEQPRRPSAARDERSTAPLPYARARLRDDLDAIVLKAMSKDTADRYASASELAGDLERFLNGHPVLARPPSSGYVLRRLAVRHKRIVGAAAAALIGILTASGAAVWQWQSARQAQASAERRFNEVRQLANALIFKIHDAVVPLAGSTPVRRTIVDEALGFLQRLEAESGGDPALRLELAAAHRQIGGILGAVGGANLGDRDGAIKQFEHARQMVAPLAGTAAPLDVTIAMVDANLRLAELYQQNDDPRSVAAAREAVDYATRFLQRQPQDHQAQELTARAHFGLALTLPSIEAVPIWQRTLEYYERVLTARPASAQAQRNVALTGKYLGAILESRDDPGSARTHYVRSLELDEQRLTAAPGDQRVVFDAAISYSNVASVSEALGDLDTAARLFEKSLTLRRQLVAGDPKNQQARARLGYLLARIARFHGERNPGLAETFGSESVEVLERALASTKDASTRVTLAAAYYELGLIQNRARAGRAACASFGKSHALYQQSADQPDADHTRRARLSAQEAASCSGN